MGSGRGRSRRAASTTTVNRVVHNENTRYRLPKGDCDLVVENGVVEIFDNGKGKIEVGSGASVELNGVWEGDVFVAYDGSFHLNGSLVGTVRSHGNLYFGGTLHGEIKGDGEIIRGASPKHNRGYYEITQLEQTRDEDEINHVITISNKLKVAPRTPRDNELEEPQRPNPQPVSF